MVRSVRTIGAKQQHSNRKGKKKLIPKLFMIRKGLGDDALYLIIHLKNLRGYILIFESFYVALALADYFLTMLYR